MMTNTLTAERIKELLDEIRAYEVLLKQYNGEPQTAPAWATLAIAKAKLTSLKGKSNEK